MILHGNQRGMDGALRKHAHAVWCRINSEQMKAVHLAHTHRKLREVSRELYLKHNHEMPDGLRDNTLRDIRNMSLAEWQQAKRCGRDPKDLKSMFQDSWSASDCRAAFCAALFEKGFVLAQGKRGHVAVDHTGEVYPVSRWVGLKAKDVRARLGKTESLPSLDRAQRMASEIISSRLRELKADQVAAARDAFAKAAKDKQRLNAERERAAELLRQKQETRRLTEQAQREARLRRGILGLIDRLTGRRSRILIENAKDAQTKALRDKAELNKQEYTHLRALRENEVKKLRKAQPRVQNARELHDDIRSLRDNQSINSKPKRSNRRARTRSRDGPEPEL